MLKNVMYTCIMLLVEIQNEIMMEHNLFPKCLNGHDKHIDIILFAGIRITGECK